MIGWLITSRVGRYLVAIGTVALAILGYGASQRHAGRNEARDAAKLDALEDALDAERIRNEIDDTTSGADARDRLRDDWTN